MVIKGKNFVVKIRKYTFRTLKINRGVKSFKIEGADGTDHNQGKRIGEPWDLSEQYQKTMGEMSPKF